MEIPLKGTRTEIPLQLAPFVANWATATYQQCDFGDLLSQTFLYKFYRIYIYRLLAERPACLPLHCTEGAVVLQLVTQGPIRSVVEGLGEILLQTGQYNFYYLPAGTHALCLSTGEYESIYIVLSATLLEELAESREEMKELLGYLRHSSKTGAGLTPRSMDYRMQELIKGMRNCRETGGNLLVEFSTNIRNLLNLYRKSLNVVEYSLQLRAAGYMTAMLSIREEIVQNPSIQQHTLTYFSRKHNMSQSTLKRYFKAVFNKTLHEFVREECMKKASWMRNNVAVSLDDIADEVGYADKSGFLKSFKQFHNRMSQ
ncbi:MAG TPA: AraC family transcriptional regulator [Chitinophaga sp.]